MRRLDAATRAMPRFRDPFHAIALPRRNCPHHSEQVLIRRTAFDGPRIRPGLIIKNRRLSRPFNPVVLNKVSLIPRGAVGKRVDLHTVTHAVRRSPKSWTIRKSPS